LLVLIEGLDGKADTPHNGRITVSGLDYYIVERVKDLTGKPTPRDEPPQHDPGFHIRAGAVRGRRDRVIPATAGIQNATRPWR
jgi:hypothetical protein